jgi:hypothetical protein
MNSYYSSIGSADGKFREIYVWAESLQAAESLVVFQWVPEYFKENNLDPTNFYSKVDIERKRQKSEFAITIHRNLFNFDDCEMFYITVRKSRGIKLYSRAPLFLENN